jgi:phosphoadenosine phosphosulfate reductase
MSVADGEADHYESLARKAGVDLEGADPKVVLRWAAETFGDKFCIAASMSDAVLISMASDVIPGVNVVFLDTGYHFAETLATRDRIAERYQINLHVLLPKQTVEQQDATFGSNLYERDPDACCSLRKIEPLTRGLAPYSAWASGIRRDETRNRRDIGVVEWDRKRRMVKVNPLASWTQALVDEYVMANDIEVNPLTYDGYPSIGCAPCTRRVLPGEDQRAGRWAHTQKTECGIHLA